MNDLKGFFPILYVGKNPFKSVSHPFNPCSFIIIHLKNHGLHGAFFAE